MRARALVTGMGVVAPTGIGTERHWAATVTGQTAISENPDYVAAGYRSTLGGAVAGFEPQSCLPPRLVTQTDRWTQFGLAATTEALEDATLDLSRFPAYEVGVITGSSSGGNEFGQREIQRLWNSGLGGVSAYQSIAWFYAATTGQISINFGAKGPSSVLVSEQAAGLDALGQARRALRAGNRVVVSGGVEAPLSPFAHACQQAAGLLSSARDPHACYRPFDAAAAGYVPGEGGAMFVVEREDSWLGRGGAQAHGEILGYAATFDPPTRSGKQPGLARAIELALADAGTQPRQVDVVFADAMGVAELDAAEASAIAKIFGPRGVAVTAPKSMTGRLYAGGSALDVATALLSMRSGIIPPTAGTAEVPAAYQLDLVMGAARQARIDVALVLARGYGGFNSVLVLGNRERKG